MKNREEVEIKLLKDYLGAVSDVTGSGDFAQKLAIFERQVSLCKNQGYNFNIQWCEAVVYYLGAKHKLRSEGIVEQSVRKTAHESSGFDGIGLALIARGREAGRLREAILLLDQAINTYADDVDFWFLRASLHKALNNKTAALNDVNYILTNYGNDQDVYLEARKLKDEIETKGGGEAAKSGGCFIATAVYGNPDSAELIVLRRFRDEILLRTVPGKAFVTVYYTVSPSIARLMDKSSKIKRAVRILVLDPIVAMLEERDHHGKPFNTQR